MKKEKIKKGSQKEIKKRKEGRNKERKKLKFLAPLFKRNVCIFLTQKGKKMKLIKK